MRQLIYKITGEQRSIFANTSIRQLVYYPIPTRCFLKFYHEFLVSCQIFLGTVKTCSIEFLTRFYCGIEVMDHERCQYSSFFVH